MAVKGNSAPAIKELGNGKIVVEYLPIERLIPYAKNAKAHPPKQVAQLTASIKEFGFLNPVLCDKNDVLIAGHGRVLGAKDAGLKELPVVRAEHLTDAQVRAFRIADNKLQMNSDFLEDLLGDELKALDDEGFDLSLLGFGGSELDKLLADDAELERAEETPDVPTIPVTIKGDVWVLGKHRLVCGDSTVATDVDKALNGVTPHLMATDPPYGINYDASWRNDAVQAGNGKRGAPSGRAIGKVANDDNADWRDTWTLFPGEVAYVWHAGTQSKAVIESLEAAGFELRAQIIWAKSNIVIGRGHYHPQHEPCWYAVRKRQGATGHWSGDRTQSTLWKIDKPQKSETGHSTQKPVECMLRPIKNNSSPGQAVYEPFSGSGTTIIAGEMSGRSVHAIELNEAYVDVAVLRWQEFASGQATLEGDGRTFDEIKQSRHGKDKDAA